MEALKEIPPFAPKVVERIFGNTVVHDSLDDYYRDRLTYKTAKSPRAFCHHCEKTYRSLADAKVDACRNWQYGAAQENHTLVLLAQVTNELGDDFCLYVVPERDYAHKRPLTSYERWMGSEISPHNRGLLRLDRTSNRSRCWMEKCKHFPDWLIDTRYYRSPKTLNERRQVDACVVDEHSPAIRGKRTKCNLPTSWDDRLVHFDRSWKQKKVRKQWMGNV
jgi:hypothetical protein